MKTMILFLLLTMPSFSFAENGLECRLDKAPANYVLKAHNIAEATMLVASDFGLPLGVEWVDDGSSIPVNKTFQFTSARNVLQWIVQSQNGYGLDYENNVVHVYPLLLHERNANFLNIQLLTFTATDEYAGEVDKRLHTVVSHLAKLGEKSIPSGAGWGSSTAIGAGERKLSFALTKVALRDVLDQEVKAGGTPMWVVTYPTLEPKLTVGGYFQTQSLYNVSLPDSSQPTWNLFFWGFTRHWELDPARRSFEPSWKPFAINDCAPAAIVEPNAPGLGNGFRPL